MVQRGLKSFRPTEVVLTHLRKIRNSHFGYCYNICAEKYAFLHTLDQGRLF